MKPIIFAVLAVIIYGSLNVILEQKFDKYNTVALSLLFTLPFVPIALTLLSIQKLNGGNISFPRGGLFWFIMLLGVFYFLADYFYLGAFTSGGDAVTIATIVLIAPVVTAVVRHIWVGGYPNGYQMAAYALAALAVLLVAKGGAIKG